MVALVAEVWPALLQGRAINSADHRRNAVTLLYRSERGASRHPRGRRCTGGAAPKLRSRVRTGPSSWRQVHMLVLSSRQDWLMPNPALIKFAKALKVPTLWLHGDPCGHG